MHVPWTQVLSDITGATGLAFIRARVAGERDPVQLARFRAPRWVRSTAAMAHAWTGHDRPDHGFALTPARALDATSTAQVREGDREIAQPCHAIRPVWPDALPPVKRADKRRSHGTNAPRSEARPRRYQLTGVDLGAIPGRHAAPGQPCSRQWAWTCGSGPTPRPSVRGWDEPPARKSRVGKSCAGARGRPATVPDRPCG
jgi:hypothetical protein